MFLLHRIRTKRGIWTIFLKNLYTVKSTIGNFNYMIISMRIFSAKVNSHTRQRNHVRVKCVLGRSYSFDYKILFVNCSSISLTGKGKAGLAKVNHIFLSILYELSHRRESGLKLEALGFLLLRWSLTAPWLEGGKCDSPPVEKEKDVGLGNYLIYAEGPLGTLLISDVSLILYVA